MSTRPEFHRHDFLCVCVFRERVALIPTSSSCIPLCIIYFISLYLIALSVFHTYRHSVSVCGSRFLESGAYVLATCYPTTGSEQNTSLILCTHCLAYKNQIRYVTVNRSFEYIRKNFLLPPATWSETLVVPPCFNKSTQNIAIVR